MKIALAGNPNSGKTTLFNAITGKTEYVGNWPGVTVEKKEADLRRRFKKMVPGARVVDLPGAYSIAPYTSDESITRDFVTGESPDVIINIVDATNLERSLFFTTQLLELNIPMVVALNKQDMLRRFGTTVDTALLSSLLSCPVIEVTANVGDGLADLIQAVGDAGNQTHQSAVTFPGKGTASEDHERQSCIKGFVAQCIQNRRRANTVTPSDRIDRIVAHAFWGIPIFALIIWAIYSFSIHGLGGMMSDYLNDTLFGEVIPDAANRFLEYLGVHPVLQALIVDGAIAGVGAVIGFLPLIMLLFFCLGLLEDSGYMARVAVIMDRYFKKIGLSGKSIIPMIVGSGCSIPGIMATRTIEDENEKKITAILTPFIPCSAKLPVIALFASVFFPGASWILPGIYLLSIALIIIVGLILKKVFHWESDTSFIFELPEYKIPGLRHAFRMMMNQAKAFIMKAATIVLVMNTLIWFAQAYTWTLSPADDQSTSILAGISGFVSPLLIPLGFIGWQLTASALTGFIAKENVVATFAVLFSAVSTDALHETGGVLTQYFTPATGLAFLAFNLFAPPCFAAVGAMNAELASRKWMLRALGVQLATGYMVALLISQVGTLITEGHTGTGFVPAVFVVIAYIAGIWWMSRRSQTRRSIPAESR